MLGLQPEERWDTNAEFLWPGLRATPGEHTGRSLYNRKEFDNMGLDMSHDAWRGAYSAFNRFRKAMADVCGVTWPDFLNGDSMVYFNDFDPETHPGLAEFFTHSDCDGEITPELCAKLADEMEPLLPQLDEMSGAGGHLALLGFGGAARRFIAGCRAAAAANEPLRFF